MFIARNGSFRISDLDRMKEMRGRMAMRPGGKAAQMMGEKGERMAAMAREEASHGPNRYVIDALTKNPPTDLAGAIKVYADLFRSLQPQAKELIPALMDATSPSVPAYDDALIDILRGPFDLVPAPMLTKDLMQTAQITWPNKIIGKARLNFGELNLLETSASRFARPGDDSSR
jgi:hypothetical protein